MDVALDGGTILQCTWVTLGQPCHAGKLLQACGRVCLHSRRLGSRARGRRLLHGRDINDRPSANEALAHPWLATGQGDRGKGTPLTRTIIQRIQVCEPDSALARHTAHPAGAGSIIAVTADDHTCDCARDGCALLPASDTLLRLQRFSQSNVVHQTVFEMIAAEILAMVPQTPGMGTPESSVHKGAQVAPKTEHHSYANCLVKAVPQAVSSALTSLGRPVCRCCELPCSRLQSMAVSPGKAWHAGTAVAMAVQRLQRMGLGRRIGC